MVYTKTARRYDWYRGKMIKRLNRLIVFSDTHTHVMTPSRIIALEASTLRIETKELHSDLIK